MSSFLVNMNFILICLQVLKNLDSTSDYSRNYIDNLRSKHVTATVFLDVEDNAAYIILLL